MILLRQVPYISIAGKHGNPCGLSIDWTSPEKTIKNALWGNPTAIWGGEFVSNFVINETCAYLLFESEKRQKYFGHDKWMLDIIVAAEFDKKSIEILGRKKRRKLFVNKNLFHAELADLTSSLKSVKGGFLIQPPNDYVLEINKLDWITKFQNVTDISSYLIAWATSYTSFHGGNEVAIANNNCLIGVGGGPSTVDAAKIATMRSKWSNHIFDGSVFAADAFFPFTDAPEVLINAGCIGCIVPSGGKNHNIIKDFFIANNVEVGFIPEKYRGFCRH